MNTHEQKRVMVLNRILAGQLSTAEAAPLLKLNVLYRQVQRLLAAYRKEGAAVVVHGNRGRKPKHALGEEVRKQALALAKGRIRAAISNTSGSLEEREEMALSRSRACSAHPKMKE